MNNEDFEEPGSSARIEHIDVDGDLDIEIDDFGVRRGPNQYQVDHQHVIKEEGELIDESLDFGPQGNKNSNKLGSVNYLDDQDSKIEIDGMDEEEEDEDPVLFIEYKYCTICHIEQPLRCKHCKTCDHCVATHDHHCPWIGNCVGERNRFSFFWFLQF